jgi:ketosteroid isomerase-like protein
MAANTPEWVVRYYKTVDGMQIDDYLAMHTDDVRLCFGNAPPAQGKDQVREGIEYFWSTIDGLHHNFVEVWEQGDTAIVEAAIDYTRKDGKVVTLPCVSILRRDGDLVNDLRIHMDVGPIYEQAPAGAP